jgi:hypothetical protein
MTQAAMRWDSTVGSFDSEVYSFDGSQPAADAGDPDATLMQKQIVLALAPIFGVKVYPQIAPDSVAAPYAVYSLITSTPENTLSNGIPIENDRMQIDCYSTTYREAHQLALATRTAMMAIPYPIGVVLKLSSDAYESDTRLHRVIQDFSVWSPRSA